MQPPTTIHTSIIIPTFNQVAMLSRLVDGLRESASDFESNIELLIVDNNSTEPELVSYLKKLTSDAPTPFAAVTALKYPYKFNYSAINNLAASKAQGKYLCFMNNDVEIIHKDWLDAMLVPMQRSSTGCVGAMLYYPDDTIQHAGVFLDKNNIAGHLYKNSPRGATGDNNFLLSEQKVSAVTAACLLVSKKVFDQVNGFSEVLAVAFNDVDFCLKVQQAGFENIWTPHAELYHHESKSRGLSHERSFLQKWKHKKEVRYMKRTWRTQLATAELHTTI